MSFKSSQAAIVHPVSTVQALSFAMYTVKSIWIHLQWRKEVHVYIVAYTTVDLLQAMVLTDCRDQLDSYGIDTALKYLENKLSENAIKRLLGENTMFAEVIVQYAKPRMSNQIAVCLF